MPPILQTIAQLTGLAGFLFVLYKHFTGESKEKLEKKEAAAVERDKRIATLERTTEHHGQRLDGIGLDRDAYRSGVEHRFQETEKKIDKLAEISSNIIRIQSDVGHINSAIAEIKQDIKDSRK